MPFTKIRRLTRVGKRSLCVVIPSPFIEELGWDDKDEIEVTLSQRSKRITMEKKQG